MAEFPEIPGYTIKKKLGRGGMATVYLAVQGKLGRLVAIKVLVPECFSTIKSQKRFWKEAQIASKLVHPNIITIHDVGRSGELHYIVMEYLEESLKERIRRRGKIEADEALRILVQIAGAMAYAHRRGFIHRDLKPDNIMFRSDGTPVILDFGLARAIESQTHLTQTGIFVGTPNYMSPEQCLAKKLDGRSDIYSLGVVFFEMLTGAPPYRGDMRQVVLKHVQGEVPRLPFALRRYQPLLDAMLAKRKRQRLESEKELLALARPLLPALALADPPEGGRRRGQAGEREKTIAAGKSPIPEDRAGRSGPPGKGRRRRWSLKRRLLLNLLLLILLTVLLLALGGRCDYLGLDKILHPG